MFRYGKTNHSFELLHEYVTFLFCYTQHLDEILPVLQILANRFNMYHVRALYYTK
jgi:hypothetical protein